MATVGEQISGASEAICGNIESLADEPTRSVEVRLLDGSTKRFEVPDLAAQRDLIRSLIHEGFEVVAVTEVSTRLEDRFLRLTEGQVN